MRRPRIENLFFVLSMTSRSEPCHSRAILWTGTRIAVGLQNAFLKECRFTWPLATVNRAGMCVFRTGIQARGGRVFLMLWFPWPCILNIVNKALQQQCFWRHVGLSWKRPEFSAFMPSSRRTIRLRWRQFASAAFMRTARQPTAAYPWYASSTPTDAAKHCRHSPKADQKMPATIPLGIRHVAEAICK